MKTKVITNKGIQEVTYIFIDSNTIECKDINTNETFITHYKSIIV